MPEEQLGSRVTVSHRPGMKWFTKTARGLDEDHTLLKREFQATVAASETFDDRGNPVALPKATLGNGYLTMETPDRFESPFKSLLSKEIPDEWTNYVRKIGEKLSALHSANVPFDANPEMPVLYPIPISMFHLVSEGALWTLEKLPTSFHEAAALQIEQLDLLPKVFIHGDLSIDNILTDDQQAVFIDWELAGMGSGLHDLASLMASFTSLRLKAQIVHHQSWTTGPAEIVRELTDFCSTLLQSYRILDGAYCGDTLMRLVSLKLLTRAQAMAAASISQSAMATLLLQLSMNLTANAKSISESLVPHV
ncbi:aminoglycoside phosphotransferase family protein [Leucobacter insecticola]|uniref:Aminoglycoside phosphotransferase family protein n=1 Tax=Leucobacter insecticola TaxID=2714934 RepID=A0A6G8FLB2_9MICO|nr:aminoglycoside phosphotransferase family protein [Leucobacter insecticola]QIM17155.1 aminoglycoside phosphotransferase family protein [Leucobacter insecticola]